MPEQEEWKCIHVAASLKELKSRTLKYNKEKICDMLKEDGYQKMFKVIDKCYEQYTQHKKDKDQEMAYIYLFRFVEYAALVQHNYKDKKYFKSYFGSTKFQTAINDLEKLDDHLRERYQKLEDNGKGKPISIEKNGESDITRQKKNKIIDEFNNQTKLKSYVQDQKTKLDYITCGELKKLVEDTNDFSVLVMDIRTETEFCNSRIKTFNIINVPYTIIQKGVSAHLLEQKLSEESKSKWNLRRDFENIVLMDFDTDIARFKPDTSLHILRTILTEWDYPGLKCMPVILNNGFKAWVETYPFTTINPEMATFLRGCLAKPAPVSLNEIEYPDSDEESKKENLVVKKNTIENEQKMSPANSSSISKPSMTLTLPQFVPHYDRSVKPSLEKKMSLDKTVTRKTFEDIFDSQLNSNKEEPPKKFLQKDDVIENEESNESQTVSSDSTLSSSSKENQKINDDENESSCSRMNWKEGDSGINYVGLKPDSSSAGSPGLKKSLSSPNITQLDDSMKLVAPSSNKPPTFDRSVKPYGLRSVDKTQYGIQEYQYRIMAQRELDGAVMGANISKGLAGLKNLGNTCYMNSILQCISNTTELREELCKFNPGGSLKNNQKSKTEGIIAREVEKVIRILWHGNIKHFSCYDLKTVLGRFRNSFKGTEQQDSHEFFTILMDWLHDDLNEPSPKGDLLGAVEETGEKAWGEFRKNNNSIVLNLFYGQQKSTVKCDSCGKQSVTFEPFSNLSLLLPSDKDICTLNECLELYLKVENITGWNCPDCKVPRSATKKVDITKLPPVLVIHFKRFTSNDCLRFSSNSWCWKKQTFVNFPLENLNMRNYSVKGSEQRNESYNLYAVSNHYGTMETGHYTAYCYNAELNRWFKFDDQEVADISPSEVKTSAAYILFYSALKR
ncbi:ubiquitin carboxyl-terminal hydrolase 8-like isoform X2 [Lycorma delicatula]